MNTGGRVTADLPPALKSNPMPADLDLYRDHLMGYLRMQCLDKVFTISPDTAEREKALGEREKIFYAFLENIKDQLLSKAINLKIKADPSFIGAHPVKAPDGKDWNQTNIRANVFSFFTGIERMLTYIEDRKTPVNLSSLMKAVIDVEQARNPGGIDDIQNFRTHYEVLKGRVIRLRERLKLTDDKKWEKVHNALRSLPRTGLTRVELEKMLIEYKDPIEDLTEDKIDTLIDEAVARRDVAKQSAGPQFGSAAPLSINALHQSMGYDISFNTREGCQDQSCNGCETHGDAAQEISAVVCQTDFSDPEQVAALPMMIAAIQKKKKDFGQGRHISAPGRNAHTGDKTLQRLALTAKEAFEKKACICCGDTRHTAHKCKVAPEALRLKGLVEIRNHLQQTRKSAISAIEEDADCEYEEILAVCNAAGISPHEAGLCTITEISTVNSFGEQDATLQAAFQAAIDHQNNSGNASAPVQNSTGVNIGTPICSLVEAPPAADITDAVNPITEDLYHPIQPSPTVYADTAEIARIQTRVMHALSEDDDYEYADLFPEHARIIHEMSHTCSYLNFTEFNMWRIRKFPSVSISDVPRMVDAAGNSWIQDTPRTNHVPTYSIQATADESRTESSRHESVISIKEARALQQAITKSATEPLASDLSRIIQAEDRAHSCQVVRACKAKAKESYHKLQNHTRHQASVRKEHEGGRLHHICDEHLAEYHQEDADTKAIMKYHHAKMLARQMLTDPYNRKTMDLHFGIVAKKTLRPSAYLDIAMPDVTPPGWSESSASAPCSPSDVTAMNDAVVWATAHATPINHAKEFEKAIRRVKSDPKFIAYEKDQRAVRDALCKRLEMQTNSPTAFDRDTSMANTISAILGQRSPSSYTPMIMCREPSSPLAYPRECCYDNCATTGFCGQCDEGYTCPWIPPTPTHRDASEALIYSAIHDNMPPISAVIRESTLKADPGNPLHVAADSGAIDSVSGPQPLAELAAAAAAHTGVLPKTDKIAPKTYQGVGGSLIASTESTRVPLTGGGSIGFRSLDGTHQKPLIGRPGLQQLGVVSDWVNDRYLSINDPNSTITEDADGKVTISGFWHDHRVRPNGHRAIDLANFVQATDIASTVETHQAFVTDAHLMGTSFMMILHNQMVYTQELPTIDIFDANYTNLRTLAYREGILKWLNTQTVTSLCEIVIDQNRCPDFLSTSMDDSQNASEAIKSLSGYTFSFAPAGPEVYLHMDRIIAALLYAQDDQHASTSNLTSATESANALNQSAVPSLFH